MLLEKAGIPFVALNANEEKELVEKYGVKQAPTLVLIKDDGIERYRGVSDIKGWLMHK
jgi:ribonucleoside-triphosphate reductase